MNDNGLISRAAAIAEIEEYLQGLDSCISEPDLKLDGYRNGLQVAIQELTALPAVDAVPVEWLREWQDEVGTLNEWWPIIERIITVWQEEQEAR